MRPLKQGLDYFPFDVDFFTDKKIRILKAKYGCDGITVYIYLLCQIYRNGYSIKLDEDYEYILSDELKMEPEKIGQIINFLLGRSLFENTLFKSDKVLTSRGIQARFQQAIKTRGTKRSVEVGANIWLLGENETESYIEVTQISGFSENNSSKSEKNEGFSKEKVHKEKEREKEIKLKENKELAVVISAYEKDISSVSPIISEKMEEWLKDADSSLILYAIEQAALQNKRNWSYINGVIKNCLKEGKKTRSDAEMKSKKHVKDTNYTPDDMAAIERQMRLERMKQNA